MEQVNDVKAGTISPWPYSKTGLSLSGARTGFDDRAVRHVVVVGDGPDHPLPLRFGGGVQTPLSPPLCKFPAYRRFARVHYDRW